MPSVLHFVHHLRRDRCAQYITNDSCICSLSRSVLVLPSKNSCVSVKSSDGSEKVGSSCCLNCCSVARLSVATMMCSAINFLSWPQKYGSHVYLDVGHLGPEAGTQAPPCDEFGSGCHCTSATPQTSPAPSWSSCLLRQLEQYLIKRIFRSECTHFATLARWIRLEPPHRSKKSRHQ